MEVNAAGDRAWKRYQNIERIKKGKMEKPCPDCRSPSTRYLHDKVMSEYREGENFSSFQPPNFPLPKLLY